MSASQPQRVTDRLAFLLALVPYLLEAGEVTVAQAAAHFDVPPEDVRAAMELIAVSGIPGESRQYQHNDLFDIDWEAFEDHDRLHITHHVAIDESPRLSNREAAALITSLQYLSALPENADRAALASLQAKLTLGSSGEPSAIAVDAEGRPQAMGPVRDAMASGSVVRFRYLNGRGVLEERAVEPLKVESVDASWYLRGWDQARGALRTFRLDRMEDVRVDSDAPLADRPVEVDIPDRIFSPSPTDQPVVLEVAEAALPVLTDYLDRRSHITPIDGRPGWLRVQLRIAHVSGLKRLVTGTPGLLRVVEPAEARAAVAEWAQAGAARYPAPRGRRSRSSTRGSAV
jgi:proteasome accessory factor C